MIPEQRFLQVSPVSPAGEDAQGARIPLDAVRRSLHTSMCSLSDKIRVVGAAFGNPLGMRTFSGLSFHLLQAIRDHGCLVGTLSTRCLRLRDLARGCLVVSRGHRAWRPRLSRQWLWRTSTVEELSRRFGNRLRQFPDANAVLQVGTHVYVENSHLRHFCMTDLTVTQAADAGRFGFEGLAADDVRGAIVAQKRIFDSCSGIFVPTEWTRESIVREFDQPPDRVLVVGEGASIEEVPFTQEKYFSRNILFVGYEWENKGGPLLYEAFQLVRASLPDATLTVVGCTPSIRDPGIRIVGRLRKDVPAQYSLLKRLYQNATCFCLLSEVDAYGIVLLEAQLCGTPVVALDRGSRRELVRSGETGLLVRDATPRAVADALLTILCSPETAEHMGALGHKFVSERFTWSAVADRILSYIAKSHTRLAT